MAMHPESAFQAACIKELKKRRIYYVNKYGDGRTGFGTPDLLTCINGRFVAFELKAGDNQLSDAQRIRADRIRKSGGAFYAPRTLDEFMEALEQEVRE